MNSRTLLYLAHERDNVATALGDLEVGASVPVVTASGEKWGELKLRSRVPRFFKVSIRDLEHQEAIVKWAQPIGRVSCSIFNPSGEGEVPLTKVLAGTIIHLTNFSPSTNLVNYWGDRLVTAANRLLEISDRGPGGAHPFELGALKKRFGVDETILVSDLDIPNTLRGALFPQTDGSLVVGRTLQPIPAAHQLHLGCVVGHGFRFPGSASTIDAIRHFYRFVKGKIYAISEDIVSA